MWRRVAVAAVEVLAVLIAVGFVVYAAWWAP
jgi:hypothetical protein